MRCPGALSSEGLDSSSSVPTQRPGGLGCRCRRLFFRLPVVSLGSELHGVRPAVRGSGLAISFTHCFNSTCA